MRVRRYFDHAASSPMSQICRDAYDLYDSQDWAGANPNSLHQSGRNAFAALEQARASLARSIGARRPSEIVFTSGGTESNNLAIRGISWACRDKSHGKRNRVLVSAIEHDSVLDCADSLQKHGFVVERIPVTSSGGVDTNCLESMMGPDVALISVMGANNEVGTVQPIQLISRIAHVHGALVHCDAVQSLGHAPFNASALEVDSASICAHKLGGPVSCGALYLKARTFVAPQAVGGGQESGFRSGTQDVRNAMAFAAVAAAAVRDLQSDEAYLLGLRELLLNGLCRGPYPRAIDTVGYAGCAVQDTLPNILHVLVPGHQSEGLVLGLDELGFEVSGGSACSSSSLEPSHVLTAMHIPRDLAFCSLRLSFDTRTTPDSCRALVEALNRVCDNSALERKR